MVCLLGLGGLLLHMVQLPSFHTGKEYEARLRQQHTKLNPRTSWARMDKKKAKKRRGFGEDSDEG